LQSSIIVHFSVEDNPARKEYFHYFVVGLRSLRKNAGYSYINISGLAIGLTAFIMIFLWVRHELSYDRFNEQADRIYRVVENQ
jgi:putative ABC transport system permease protein